MIIELPCGIVKDGVVYDHVRIKELTGKQQNYLMDFDLVSDTLGHIPKLLTDLAVEYQTKDGKVADIKPEETVWLISTDDIEVILVKIRQATFGKMLAMQVTCPRCGKQQTVSLDLSKLKIKNLKDKKKRSVSLTLKKSKKKVVVRLLGLQQLFDLNAAIREANKEFYTTTVALSLEEIDGKSPVKPEDIEDIPLTDLQQIDKAFDKIRGSIDNKIEHECDACKSEFDTPLPVVEPGFFAPSQTLSI